MQNFIYNNYYNFALKRIFYIFVLLIVCFLYFLIILSVENPTFTDLRIIGIIGIFQFVFSIYSCVKTGQKLVSPYTIFLIVLYMFQVGQTLMYGFNIISEKDAIFYKNFSIESVFKASIISLYFIAFFQIGALLYAPKKFSFEKNNSDKSIIRLRRIGLIICIVTIIPYYYELIHEMIISITFGYGAIYAEEEKVGLASFLSALADYFVPGLICLFIGYSKNKILRNIITAIFLFNSSIIFVTGGRTNAVIILALLLILYNYLVKSFSKKQYVLIFVGSFFVLALIVGIAKMRNNSSRDFADTYTTINEDSSSNPVIDAVSEMGGTIQCLIWTDEIISNNNDYRLGKSYFYSFYTLIPNFGFWKIHPAKKEAALGHWLMQTKGLTYGPGFSMAAEAYLNFGYFGCIIFFIFGYLASKIFGNLGQAVKYHNYPLVILILVFFWLSLKLPRGSFIGVVRSFFFYALPLYWYTRGYIIKLHPIFKTKTN